MTRPARVIHKPRAKWFGGKGRAYRATLQSWADDESADPSVRLMALRHLAEVDGRMAVKSSWEFVMSEAALAVETARHLAGTSTRPLKAIMLFLICLRELEFDEGRVKLSRAELAEELGVTPRTITRLMRELIDADVVARSVVDEKGRRGRAVSWKVNPNLAWRGSEAARRAAAARWPGGVTVIDGGSRRGERRKFAAPAPVAL